VVVWGCWGGVGGGVGGGWGGGVGVGSSEPSGDLTDSTGLKSSRLTRRLGGDRGGSFKSRLREIKDRAVLSRRKLKETSENFEEGSYYETMKGRKKLFPPEEVRVQREKKLRTKIGGSQRKTRGKGGT